MTTTLSIKDVLGANVDADTLNYFTDGENVTVSSAGQYTYYATADLSGKLDGHDIGTGKQVFTLEKYGKPQEDWASSYCFRSEGSYDGEIDGKDAKIYAYFTLTKDDISGTGTYTISNQVLGELTISNIVVHRVLTASLTEKLGDDGVLNSEWINNSENSSWISSHVTDVTQAYCETVKDKDLAKSLALNTDLVSQKQTYKDATAAVSEVLEGAVIATSTSPVTLKDMSYNVNVNNAKEVSQYEGSGLAEIVKLKEGTVNVKDKNSEVSGNKYVSSADGKTYVLKSYALGNAANDTIYGTKSNDWINGQDGNDVIYGGAGGHDMLSGGTGDDTIVAGGIVTRKEATGSDTGTTLKSGYIQVGSEYVKLNTTASELYGDAGNDTIYSGKGNDFIWAETGNDTINLNGGTNTLCYTDVIYDANGFGQDTINGLTKNDTLEFYISNTKGTKFWGYGLSNLKFSSTPPSGANNKADLTITALDASGNETTNKITIKDFYVNDSKGNLIENRLNLNVLSEEGLAADTLFDAATHVSTKTASVSYSTDGKIYVDNVSDYTSVKGLSEIVTLKNAGKSLQSYESSADGKIYQIFAKANLSDAGTDNTLEDTVFGSASNDIITGGSGKDILFGGTAGHDIISGGAGDDIIVAGSKSTLKSDLNISELDGSSDKFYAKINATGSELNGGFGNDVIYSSKGNDFIAGNEGNDTINLNGGINTLYFTETDASNAFGNDTVNNATAKDVLQFFKGESGYEFKDLIFTKSGDDLSISNSHNTVGAKASSLLIKDFFKTAKVDKLIAANSQKIETTYSILKDAVIDVGTISGKSFTGTSYNESITMGSADAEFTMGASNNTINYSLSSMGNSTINLTKGENLNLKFASTDDISSMTYTVDDTTKDLTLSVGSKNIIIKSYMSGKTGANVQINGKDMYDWKSISDSLSSLSKDSTYDAEEAADKKGILKGSDMSDYFDVEDYVSDTVRGVTITSGAGDDTVKGSNYNDTVRIKSGNNDITENEGTNNIVTGAGNDKFTASNGGSSNTVNLGNGNNTVDINSIGTNRITTGNGNDNITVSNGTNTIRTSAGNNILSLNGGINNVVTGKGNDSYALSAGENVINAGAGSDKFNITSTSGTNKIISSGSRNDLSTFDITGTNSINNIKSGASSDKYTISANSNNIIDSGAGNDTFNISAGSNNIKTGAGDDNVTISGGTNIIDAGAGIDKLNVSNGTNNIKSGAGDDDVTISGGTNVIDTGAGNDIFTVSNGKNTVNTGAGNDIITINGGTNVIAAGAGNDTFKITTTGGKNNLNGGAGKDTYDLTSFVFDNDMIISDTSGISTFKFDDITKIGAATNGTNYSFYADVVRVSTSVAKSGYVVTGYSIVKDTITSGAVSAFDAKKISMDLGRNNKAEIAVGNNAAVTVDIAKIAESVAGWLKYHDYVSVSDVFNGTVAADKNNFLQTFTADNITSA